jgi:hypothetical protein
MRTEVIKARNIEYAPMDRIFDTLGSDERASFTVRGGTTYDTILGAGGVRGRTQVITASSGGLVHSTSDPVFVPTLPQREYIPLADRMASPNVTVVES